MSVAYRLVTFALGVLALGAPPAMAADPAAAEREYRIARRLAADGAPEARAAFLRVVELAPEGELADDALVEAALLDPLPLWPEELGRLAADAAARSLELLDRAIRERPGSDRSREAHHRRGLLLLEPFPFHDPSRARTDLVTATAAPRGAGDEHEPAARYALAWLAEQQGRTDAAEDTYLRLVVDDFAETRARSRLGLGRVLLRGGRFGEAARWLEEAAALDPEGAPGARALLELAVRSLLRETGAPLSAGASRVLALPEPRSPAGVAVTEDGGRLVVERRGAGIVRLDPDGRPDDRWEVPSAVAVAASAGGRLFAADSAAIFRLEPRQPAAPVASLATFGPPSAMAATIDGTLWLLDRKGERAGLLRPGAAEPETVWERPGARLESLAASVLGIVAAEPREGRIVAIAADGNETPLALATLLRPVAIAVDPTGRLAVLDERTRRVAFFRGEAVAGAGFETSVVGVPRAAAIGFSLDGALHVTGADGTAVRVE